MKAILPPCFFLLLTISSLQGQQNVLKIGSPSIFPVVIVAYQRALGSVITGGIAFETGQYGKTTIQQGQGAVNTYYRVNAIGCIGELRAYPFKKREIPKGFFLGLHYRLYQVKETYWGETYRPNSDFNKDVVAKSSIVNIGIAAGYQWGWDRFTFETLFGFGPTLIINESPDQELIDPGSVTDLKYFQRARLEISIGFYLPGFE